MKIPTAFLVFCFGFLSVQTVAQGIVYDILLAGRPVGELVVSPALTADGTRDLRVRGAIKTAVYRVVYVGENRFEKGVLQLSLSSQEVNGKLKEKTLTVRGQEGYLQTFTDPKTESGRVYQTTQPIVHTVTGLYYREPVSLSKVYSERFGTMSSIRRVSAGTYEVTMPDDKKTLYIYADGKCQEVHSEIVGINLVFKARTSGAN